MARSQYAWISLNGIYSENLNRCSDPHIARRLGAARSLGASKRRTYASASILPCLSLICEMTERGGGSFVPHGGSVDSGSDRVRRPVRRSARHFRRRGRKRRIRLRPFRPGRQRILLARRSKEIVGEDVRTGALDKLDEALTFLIDLYVQKDRRSFHAVLFTRRPLMSHNYQAPPLTASMLSSLTTLFMLLVAMQGQTRHLRCHHRPVPHPVPTLQLQNP